MLQLLISMQQNNVTVVIGNDDEFGILSMNYDKGYNFAKSLANEIDLVIFQKR